MLGAKWSVRRLIIYGRLGINWRLGLNDDYEVYDRPKSVNGLKSIRSKGLKMDLSLEINPGLKMCGMGERCTHDDIRAYRRWGIQAICCSSSENRTAALYPCTPTPLFPAALAPGWNVINLPREPRLRRWIAGANSRRHRAGQKLKVWRAEWCRNSVTYALPRNILPHIISMVTDYLELMTSIAERCWTAKHVMCP